MSGRGRAGVWFDRFLALAVLAVTGVMLLRPGGPVRNRIGRFLADRRADAVLRDRWHQIAGIAVSDAPGRRVLVEFMNLT